MALTIRDVVEMWLRDTAKPDDIMDVFMMTKAQQLTFIKGYAATRRDQAQALLNQQAAISATLQQQITDLNTIATS